MKEERRFNSEYTKVYLRCVSACGGRDVVGGGGGKAACKEREHVGAETGERQ